MFALSQLEIAANISTIPGWLSAIVDGLVRIILTETRDVLL